MRTLIAVIVVAGALVLSAPAEVVKPPQEPPQLSTADKVAIQSEEQAKIKANQEFQQADQIERQIEAEFAQSHPGWHLDPRTFTVVANPDASTSAPKKK